MRTGFQEGLDFLEERIQEEGALVVQAIHGALVAIEDWDPGILDHLGDLDTRVDDLYLVIEQQTETLLARQAPVAGDLRALLAILHVNIHLERMSHNCVRIGRLAAPTSGAELPREFLEQFRSAATQAAEMTRIALDAFALRDLARAEQLADRDESVDRETADVLVAVIDGGGVRYGHEAAAHALFVGRCLERIADHAVKIGEQVAYLVTGAYREFTARPPAA